MSRGLGGSPFRSAGERSDQAALDGTISSPYAFVSPVAALRVRYWPCLGVWPLVLSLLLAVPIALWARRDAAFPSTLTCTSAFRVATQAPWEKSFGAPPKASEAVCSAHDARVIRSLTHLPCSAIVPAFEGMLFSRNPFDRPFVYAVESDPVTEDSPDSSHAIDPMIDPTGGIDPATARGLLAACAEAPPVLGMPRTVQVAVLDRDYLPSVVVLGATLVTALVLGLRRRVLIDIDPAQRFAIVLERGFVRERRTLVVSLDDLADVDVATGASGFLSGRRVELLRADGARLPLTETYAPLTFGVHHQVARRLRACLAGLRARPASGRA